MKHIMDFKLTKNNKIGVPTKWLLIAAIVLAVIVVVAYVLYLRHKKKQQRLSEGEVPVNQTKAMLEKAWASVSKQATDDEENSSSAFSGNAGITHIQEEAASSVFPLKIGSKGKEVEQLQIYLMKKAGGMKPSDLTGEFDSITMEKLQKHLGRDQMSERNFLKRKINQERTYKYV